MNCIETRVATKFRQRAIVAAVALFSLVAGCGPVGTGAKSRLAGDGHAGVAADDPYATMVARDILTGKGTATDAAVAIGFVLAVTYPAAASLGGGGICAVFDGPTGNTETIDFLPRRPSGGGSVAVPGYVRGLSSLHARYGRMPWATLLDAAEEIARTGRPISRALARNLAAVVATDAGGGLRRSLAGLDGKPLAEGDGWSQVELASTIAVLKARGGGDLYNGFLARQYVDAAQRAGGALTASDMRDYVVVWREAARVKAGALTLATAQLPMNGGLIGAQMWAMLLEGDRYTKAPDEEIPHLLAETSLRAYDDLLAADAGTRQISTFRAHTLMQTYDSNAHGARHSAAGSTPVLAPYAGADGATSFVVADNDGSAVACALTLGRSFGIGWIDPVTGIIPAAAVDVEAPATYLAPILVIRGGPDQVIFAGAATGGVGAPAALVQTGIAVVAANRPLAEALQAPRLLHTGSPDRVLVERGFGAAATLARRGHAVGESGPLGYVNAFSCPQGLGRGQGACFYVSDFRGSGLQLALPRK
ncbi:MAG: hypothetical protein EXQ91_06960 [Alphaproteobacteria bacterium]|nr:hypothetical protein [Alphaproteobacteria bacterium]